MNLLKNTTLQSVVKGKISWIREGMWLTLKAKWHDSICLICVTPKLRQSFSWLSFTNKTWTFSRTQVAGTVCPCTGCLGAGKSCSPNAPNHSLGALILALAVEGRMPSAEVRSPVFLPLWSLIHTWARLTVLVRLRKERSNQSVAWLQETVAQPAEKSA